MNEKEFIKTPCSSGWEFVVLSQLALRGFDANMTIGNTKSVDILISVADGGTIF